jgi:hypothetical protein
MRHRPKQSKATWPLLCLLAVSGCSSSGTAVPAASAPAGESASSVVSGTQPSPPADGSDAQYILTPAIRPADKLGGGYGTLRSSISNTLARTPDGVASVSLLFACTGAATVTLKAYADGKEVPSARGVLRCGDSVFERSIPLARPSSVSFDVDVDGSTDGSFAYAYLREKTNPPSDHN